MCLIKFVEIALPADSFSMYKIMVIRNVCIMRPYTQLNTVISSQRLIFSSDLQNILLLFL